MKQALQLKVSQQLTMTPQLQQAIRLLQLSSLDLQQEIQSALDENPLLEQEEAGADSDADGENPESAQQSNLDNATPEDSNESTIADGDNAAQGDTENTADGEWNEDIPADMPIDSAWDEVYTNGSATSNSLGGEAPDNDFEARRSAPETLQQHLLWQLNLCRFSEADLLIAHAIIDAIDEQGRLSLSCEDIHESLSDTLSIELDEVNAVLHRIQQFDPPGVAAKDLQECLCIQLRQLPADTPWREQALKILEKHMALLGSRDYAQLMRRSRLREPQLKQVLELIQTLKPIPGDSIDSREAEYIVPDVYVRKINGAWRLELNPDNAPRLRINSYYAGLSKSGSSSDNSYIREHLQEARWFIKSLQSRNDTLMKVAGKIVEVQQDFLEHGAEAMKPMVLADIADMVEMHESTISRVTTQKYMHTPAGIFELKYFFSSHVATDSGGEASSTAIRALIKKLIAEENPKKPLSDNKIATLLGEQGIKVARRTIAKYRESMMIPPSNERKQLV